MAEPAFLIPQEEGNALPISTPGGRRPKGRTHGTIATYAWGCRCLDCRAAKRLYSRQNQSHQIARRQRELATKYVRENLPHTWARLRLEAEEQIDAAAADAVKRAGE